MIENNICLERENKLDMKRKIPTKEQYIQELAEMVYKHESEINPDILNDFKSKCSYCKLHGNYTIPIDNTLENFDFNAIERDIKECVCIKAEVNVEEAEKFEESGQIYLIQNNENRNDNYSTSTLIEQETIQNYAIVKELPHRDKKKSIEETFS